ncbi:MAG: sulfotransferase family protein [Promethearchaeati archaeon]
MIKISFKPKNQKNNVIPILEYYGYVIAKLVDSFSLFSTFIDKLETLYIRKTIGTIEINSPIFITGIPRSGTTITLEMLAKHPEVASHKYKHLLMPYIPYWFSNAINKLKISLEPTERIHQDRIFINQDSPEAVEEIFWQRFFENVHNESDSNILDNNTKNEEFENFYKNHIKKLLISQESSRYIAKNNYNLTRLEYLIKIFPDVKFVILIRNPINQIASIIKQQKSFIKMESISPLLSEWNNILGHHEFGNHSSLINLNDYELVKKIRSLLKNKNSYVKGWGYYWTSLYDHVMKIIKINKKVKKASLIVRYEDLCESSSSTIDKILDHTNLPHEQFDHTKKYYVRCLEKPSYYKPHFSDIEIENILKITRPTAKKYGYQL